MILAAISAFNWVRGNWKLVAIFGGFCAAFSAGYYVRGYIAEAAQNKAIAAAIELTKTEERGLYEKAIEQEKRKRAIRERARVANVGINTVVSDQCSDVPVNADFLRLIREAVGY
jgi:pyruvoyl-dependent arginine decarboxylase (PvlArgDC)